MGPNWKNHQLSKTNNKLTLSKSFLFSVNVRGGRRGGGGGRREFWDGHTFLIYVYITLFALFWCYLLLTNLANLLRFSVNSKKKTKYSLNLLL